MSSYLGCYTVAPLLRISLELQADAYWGLTDFTEIVFGPGPSLHTATPCTMPRLYRQTQIEVTYRFVPRLAVWGSWTGGSPNLCMVVSAFLYQDRLFDSGSTQSSDRQTSPPFDASPQVPLFCSPEVVFCGFVIDLLSVLYVYHLWFVHSTKMRRWLENKANKAKHPLAGEDSGVLGGPAEYLHVSAAVCQWADIDLVSGGVVTGNRWFVVLTCSILESVCRRDLRRTLCSSLLLINP